MASAKPAIFLLFCLFGFGMVSGTTDPGDGAVLRSLRRIWQNLPPNWGDSDDPCGMPWDGIACSNSRIIRLTLTSMGLDGTLAAIIGQLSELQFLDLSYNLNLTGSIPSSIGNLQKLETLSLSACNLEGIIPPEIGNLQKLTFLALNSNKLTGGIPRTVAWLSDLHWFDLADNRLTGPLPVSSGNTPGLDQLVNTKHFHFGINQLSGTIPESLFHSKMTLIHLLFEGNNFTGPIPASIGLMQQLTVLRLDRNALTGAVPSGIGNLTRLRELNLAYNGLTGDVPDLSGITSLKYVDLSNNLFTSSVAPLWFVNLRSLSALLMQYNGLIGEVPTAIFSSPQLQELILTNNKFNGTVDLGTAVGSGPQLVDLRGNIITGVSNEPQVNSTTLLLIGNPVCNTQIDGKSYCQSPVSSQAYSTVSECTNKCAAGRGNRPGTCECSHPYTGTLFFRGPLFRGLRNSSRFRRLERDLQGKLNLGDNSVSLQNSFFDANQYLLVSVELFPPNGDLFSHSEVQRLGSTFSTQGFTPHEDEWGPYVFKAEAYIFGDSDRKEFSHAVVAGIAASCGGLLIGLIMLGIYARRARREANRTKKLANPFANWAKDEEALSAPQLNGVISISFSDVKKCSDDFSNENKIGAGGYGKVYKGKLLNGEMVAIKRAKPGSMQGSLEFKTEIELLSRVHHMNLVRLVGFCYEKGEQMLIYEYVSNGTLGESLSGKRGIRLSWIDRLRIALGSARGLAYLHELAHPPIIHRDVKTANILLDERLTAKVADFGMSKLVSDAADENTDVKGTMGYLDPEYFESLQLTDKSDVYSFGVVMLELLTGRKPIEGNRYIVLDVKEVLHSNDGLKKVIDPIIRNEPVLVGLERFVGLAMSCVRRAVADRPSMREVVKDLESILEKEGIYSRSISMSSSVRETKGAAAGSRRTESASSYEMSSSAFDSSSGVVGYISRTKVNPK